MFRIACLALFVAPGFAYAQHHGGGHAGGGHMGGAHMGGAHMGGHPGGYHMGGYPPLVTSGYRGGYGNYRGGYGGFSSFGVPYYGGFGYPYGYGYGGIGLGYGYGGLGYGYGMGSAYGYRTIPYSAPAVIGGPAVIGPSNIPAAPVDSFTTPAAATVDVVVPEGAKVWFNDKAADVKDGKATFTSDVLQAGQGPTLHVKARWDERDRDMYLTLRAGDKMSVDLRKN